MSIERKILTITKPTILLDEMSIPDTESPNAKLKDTSNNPSKKAGSLFPLVEINKYKFTEEELQSVRIDETGFIPTITVDVISTDGVFLSTAFPKDGDIISIYIRSKIKEFKPIRSDFEITLVNSFPSTDETGEKNSYTITGVLRVPGLFTEHCKAFKDKTSYDALLDVTKDLKLGFATNETSTQDKMNWICPFDTYEDFIENTTSAAYKDDDSFYTAYLDHFYFLNFVNMNNQFSEEVGVDEAIESLAGNTDFYNGRADQKNYDGYKIILSNNPNLKGSSMFVESYTLLNKAGQIAIENGYRRFVQFYDANLKSEPKERYQSQFIEPLNTKGTTDKILMRGRAGETIVDTHNKYKWLGTQYALPDGNMHENYMYANIQNWQNNQELNKMVFQVVLPQCNFNLYRGQRIPVVILNNGNAKRKQMTLEEGQSIEDTIALDKFLSGYYVIQGYRYLWDNIDNIFRQEVFLTRREWGIPVKMKQNG